ncbi:STAS domain-containing protein [Bacillus massiliglaciei]|uniref:STAS domain-containing protein n=1 Tax=Bacillus massiliglaciei TaxID=1816693 RepID=UPI000DA602FD|nr:STAS domain-containing protein [Bacillus massiliglaciei]
MKEIGTMPANLNSHDVFVSIDEIIILADLDYTVTWMNPTAAKIMDVIAPLYGIPNAEAMIGRSMDFFHTHPETSRRIMDTLDSTFRVTINIKDLYIGDTVITPVFDEQGHKQAYLLMLLDVTAQVKEEEKKDQLIEQLSVPVLNIWDHIYAVPIIGEVSFERMEYLTHSILDVCSQNNADYFLIDVSGISKLSEAGLDGIHKITEMLKLIGTACYVVGIGPKLAQDLAQSDFKGETFQSIKAAIKYIYRTSTIQSIMKDNGKTSL